MKASLVITAAASVLLVTGCASRTTVAPSQNPSLNAVSPATAEDAEPGFMQRSLDAWLKEEWTPLTTPASSQAQVPPAAENGQPSPSAAAVQPSEPADKTPFTLQKYADKWKVYLENKEKMNAGKPKDPSHTEYLNRMPLIAK